MSKMGWTSAWVGLATAAIVCVPVARAGVKTLQVANPAGAGQGFAGFVSKEIAAAVLSAAPGDFPYRILQATVRVGAAPLSGHSGSGTMRVWLWRDTGGIDPGEVLYEGRLPMAVQAGENTFDLSAQGIIVTSGNVRLGFEIVQEGADVFVDNDGLTAGRNFILGKLAGTTNSFRWQAVPQTFLSADFLVALEVETNVADGGAVSDGGTIIDGGPAPDAGTVADGGTATDAGIPVDGGTSNDGGTIGDGGPDRFPSSGCLCAGGADAGGDANLGLLLWLVAAGIAVSLQRRNRNARSSRRPSPH